MAAWFFAGAATSLVLITIGFYLGVVYAIVKRGDD